MHCSTRFNRKKRISAQILQQVPMEQLQPGQQAFASTLSAELAMTRNQPKAALTALSHPSLQRLSEMSVPLQVRAGTVHARALEADGQTLAAARERRQRLDVVPDGGRDVLLVRPELVGDLGIEAFHERCGRHGADATGWLQERPRDGAPGSSGNNCFNESNRSALPVARYSFFNRLSTCSMRVKAHRRS